MHMPPLQGYKYLVQVCDLLTGWPEWRALTRETGRTLGQFIFDELLCRWGGLEEIVTDKWDPVCGCSRMDRNLISHLSY